MSNDTAYRNAAGRFAGVRPHWAGRVTDSDDATLIDGNVVVNDILALLNATDFTLKMFQMLRPRDQVEGSGMGLAVVRKQIEVFDSNA